MLRQQYKKYFTCLLKMQQNTAAKKLGEAMSLLLASFTYKVGLSWLQASLPVIHALAHCGPDSKSTMITFLQVHTPEIRQMPKNKLTSIAGGVLVDYANDQTKGDVLGKHPEVEPGCSSVVAVKERAPAL
jgi:hypothetical protein